ncbi:putative pirin-like protein At3g59260 [Brassica napus]|uniref:putative pirin-like protein At3g59260 n=1 Tax=Brassica napus TaxID=3708 RepID=UPI00207AC9EA|nr:putative pirin-like protein At3g59260 [Brassica napus]
MCYLVFNRIDPKALELSSSEIPRAEEDVVEVKVIAGESMGVKSPFYTKVPIMFLDITLKQRAQTHQTVPESWTAFAYVIDGDDGVFRSSDSYTVQAHTVVVLGKGDGVSVLNTSSFKPLRFLLIAGEPISEPVVQHGPFVMNSQAEIDMTIEDYRSAKNGFEGAKSWRSE